MSGNKGKQSRVSGVSRAAACRSTAVSGAVRRRGATLSDGRMRKVAVRCRTASGGAAERASAQDHGVGLADVDGFRPLQRAGFELVEEGGDHRPLGTGTV